MIDTRNEIDIHSATVPLSSNKHLLRWVEKIAELTKPSSIHWVDGSVEERKFVALYGRAGKLTGALAFSRPRPLMGYRRLLADGASFEDALAIGQSA